MHLVTGAVLVMVIVWICFGAACLFGCFSVAVLAIIADVIRQQGRQIRPVPSDTAVVLGAYTNGYQPGHALMARLRASLELYRQGIVKAIIVSGGRGEDETVAESSAMKRFLILNGVDPGVVIEDWHSVDTWENLRNSQAVMKAHGFRTCVVVTSDYHLPRALAVAKQLELNASGYAAWSRPREFHYAIREVFAYLKYWWSGQLRVA